MKKFIILIPVFNDWESLSKLIKDISVELKEFKKDEFKFVILNDGSTNSRPKFDKPENILSIKILNMKINKGHTFCIAFGIHYVLKNEEFDNLILMDGDGEDRPEEVISLIKKNLKNLEKSVIAKRVKRSEGILFTFLYQIHKLITLIFTGHNINFGNFTFLTKKDLTSLSKEPLLWKSYSASFKKNIKNFTHINSIRGKRFFGPSKMSFFKLVFHSLSIIAVFKHQVFLRSAFLLIIFSYLSSFLDLGIIIPQILIALFCLVIFSVSLNSVDNNYEIGSKNFNSINEIAQ
tara:strand:- start:662 stop:1534 length:873 start_codon:yes stop_codon:yes gene_type:complete